MAQLDDKCSNHFFFRDLIQCGETFREEHISNLPQNTLSWNALSAISKYILDPVVDKFGQLTLTYGFCSPELIRSRNKLSRERGICPAIYPKLDQHCCYEVNSQGQQICLRGGAACDFLVPDISTRIVARWVVENLPFDRLYFYGADKPLHVSYNSEGGCQEVTAMKPKASGRGYVPGTISVKKFLEL